MGGGISSLGRAVTPQRSTEEEAAVRSICICVPLVSARQSTGTAALSIVNAFQIEHHNLLAFLGSVSVCSSGGATLKLL